jgi:hypothetical protein
MMVKGREFRYVDVDVSSRDVLTKLFDKWKVECVKQSGEDVFVRCDQWVSYDDCRGQGSGLTEVIREATEEEIGIYKAFRILFSKLTFKD